MKHGAWLTQKVQAREYCLFDTPRINMVIHSYSSYFCSTCTSSAFSLTFLIHSLSNTLPRFLTTLHKRSVSVDATWQMQLEPCLHTNPWFILLEFFSSISVSFSRFVNGSPWSCGNFSDMYVRLVADTWLGRRYSAVDDPLAVTWDSRSSKYEGVSLELQPRMLIILNGF
jgi:hypothetical protein